MAATVVKLDQWSAGNKRYCTGYYTLAQGSDTLTVPGMRMVHFLDLIAGDGRGSHSWCTAVASRPVSATNIRVGSTSASYTTGSFLAIGY